MWIELLVIVARGLLQYYVEEHCTPAAERARQERRRKPAPKETPRPAGAEEPMHSAGWGPPKEASLVNLIKIETDDGTTVAAASFIGEESFGVTRVQRERQAGESRRTRRKAQPAAVPAVDAVPAADTVPVADAMHADRDRFFAAARERVRYWARHQDEVQRLVEEAEAEELRRIEACSAPSTAHLPATLMPAPRVRRAGEPPLAVSWLATETLLLLELGEPLTYVGAAA